MPIWNLLLSIDSYAYIYAHFYQVYYYFHFDFATLCAVDGEEKFFVYGTKFSK